jgi:hypothetical protein
MVGAPVRGDDEVGLEVGADGLDQDVDLRLLALAARGVADHPAHGVAGRHRDQLLAGLEGNVGDLAGGGVELVEGAPGVGIDLDGIDVTVLHRLDLGERMGLRHPLLGLLVVLGLVPLLRDRLQLSRKRQWLRHLDDPDRRLLVGPALSFLEDRAVEDRDLRHAHAGGAGREHKAKRGSVRREARGAHLGSPEVTSCDQLKACT